MSTPKARSRFGKRIIALRREKEWDQKDLAEASGLAPSIISRVENGTRAPSLETLTRLRDALGVGDDAFLGWIDLLNPEQRKRSAA